jgi:hypothetical protein
VAFENKPGDLYWQKIAAAFDAVSIYDGPSVFAQQFAELEPEVGNLLAAHWCQSEVCNGGFHQFFSNSTGVLAPEALAGFQALGLREWASLLREAMNSFGATYPRDREQRQRLLSQPVKGKRREEWDPFSSLDDRFYEYLRLGESVWEKSADAYAARPAA